MRAFFELSPTSPVAGGSARRLAIVGAFGAFSGSPDRPLGPTVSGRLQTHSSPPQM